jgi:hypothetical protein
MPLYTFVLCSTLWQLLHTLVLDIRQNGNFAGATYFSYAGKITVLQTFTMS